MPDKEIKITLPAPGAEVSIIPVIQGEISGKLNESELPNILPILALRNAAIFPGAIFPITIGREASIKVVREAEKNNTFLGAVPQLEAPVEEPGVDDLCHYGSVCKVLKNIDMPDGTITSILQAFKRIEIINILSFRPIIKAKVEYLNDFLSEDPHSTDITALSASLKEKSVHLLKSTNFGNRETLNSLREIDDFGFLVNFLATTVDFENFSSKLELLGIDDLKLKGFKLLAMFNSQLELIRVKQEINQKVRSEMDKQQREYYLNSQLRTIQEELGMDGGEEYDKFKRKAATKKWSKEVEEIFNKELSRLQKYNPSSPDYSVQYNYVEFLLNLPWGEKTVDNMDLDNARKVLDEDHFGLDKVKERIIEYLAVLKLKGNMKSPILCLYGPPGVGKTSLGKSVARALGRKYIRVALGGMHDEAEIRGHRKTYVGALPGRILNGIARAGSSNPVILLDEIDKLSKDFKGDPSSALLEALDPEQNGTFHDNYLDIDYDLSNVLFITTANSTSPIQPALLDRMELIDISGYIAEEKLQIAKKFLIPKQLEEHGLPKNGFTIEDGTLRKIIDEYTHESGVRGLEKKIAKIARVTAKKTASKQRVPRIIKDSHLKEYLGLPTSFHDKQEGNQGVGIVTGLAWTQMGGEILFVESSISKGKGILSMTGNLGDVMKESSTIAYQFIKAHPELIDMTPKAFAEKDIHVHVPEGATPKDGPSAGITMVCSIVSALRNKALKEGIAMTGEMTLRGKVLPVGGIKEKILAAKRAGVKTIVLCKDNRKDIEDIDAIYVEGLNFHYVNTIQDVLNFVFE